MVVDHSLIGVKACPTSKFKEGTGLSTSKRAPGFSQRIGGIPGGTPVGGTSSPTPPGAGVAGGSGEGGAGTPGGAGAARGPSADAAIAAVMSAPVNTPATESMSRVH